MEKQCPQHQEFVMAVTDLVSAVSVLSTDISWMEKMGKWVMGLCVSVICLVLVGIFYAGAMWQQVQQNTNSLRDYRQHIQGASYVQEQEEQVYATIFDQLLFKTVRQMGDST